MKQKLLLFLALLLANTAIFAQISTLPSTQSFDAAFSATTGTNVAIYTNYVANEVAASSRIYRDLTTYNSAPAAMSIIPTSAFAGQVVVSFNLSNYTGTTLSFVAKGMQNSTGSTPTVLKVAVSINGAAYTSEQTIATFANSAASTAAPFANYNYTLPAGANNQTDVKLKIFTVDGTGGTGTRAKVVLDDLSFTGTYAPAPPPPAITASSSALSLAQAINYTGTPQTVSVSGSNLTAAVTLQTAAPFEVSLAQASGYGTSVTLPQTAGALASTPVYVRLINTVLGSSAGSITVATTGASNSTITLTGNTTTCTNPTPYNLSSGNYTFTEWDPATPAGTYPANMTFWTHATTDPTLTEVFAEDYACKYNLTSKSRVTGKAANGVSFINTTSSQDTSVCGGATTSGTAGAWGRNGAAVLALNTTGLENVMVDWTGRTILLNSQTYGFRLQYRIGAGDVNLNWQDIPNGNLSYTEYVAGANNSSANFTTALPDATDNQPVVQLRWVYYRVSGSSDARSEIALDDITVYPAPIVVTPTVAANTSSLSLGQQIIGAPTANQAFTVSGSSLEGDVTVQTSAPYEISITEDSGFTTSLILPQTAGSLAPTTIYVRQNSAAAGTFTGNVAITSTNATTDTVALTGTAIMPLLNNPEPFDLSTGNYVFNAWDPASPAGTYPANMRLWTHATTDPTITTQFLEDYTCIYSLPNGARFVGEAANGISMINTGSAQYVNVCNGTVAYSDGGTSGGASIANGRPGAIVLALNTTGKQNILVNWTGKTIKINPRVYSLRIQYRIGAGAANSNWQDIPNGTSAYTEYVTGTTEFAANPAAGSASFATLLPADAANQPIVQVRWVNNYISGTTTGARSQLALDDVTVSTPEDCSVTTTWNGTAWSNGTPTSNIYNAVIAGNFTSAQNVTACSLTVNSGAASIATGHSLILKNTVTVTGGSLTIQDNAALVQDNIATNSGAVTVVKNSNPLYRLDYTMWSSPVVGQNLLDFSPLTNITRFYEYKYAVDPSSSTGAFAEQYFGIATPSAVSFTPAKGYLIRMPNTNASDGYNAGTAAITYPGEFTGIPNNGIVTIPLSTTGDRYTAVGNPYPSPINVGEFFAQNAGVLDAASPIYFWRKKNNAAVSSYATLTNAAYVANTAGGGNINTNYYVSANSDNWTIAQGQGFIVRTATNLTNPQLEFYNSMRRAVASTGTQAFFKVAPSQKSRLWLNLTNGTNGFSQAAVAYIDGATTGLDYSYDGQYFGEANTVALYSLAANTNLAVQARPVFETADVVPMGFIANAAGQYTIALDHADGLFAGDQEIYIKDNTEGLTHSLKNSDYTFATEAGTFTNRFEVVYTTDALGTQNPVLNANSVIVYKQGAAININSGTAEMTDVTIYDIRGRKLYSQSNINATQTAITGLQVQNEVLIVEINTAKGKVSKKIVF